MLNDKEDSEGMQLISLYTFGVFLFLFEEFSPDVSCKEIHR